MKFKVLLSMLVFVFHLQPILGQKSKDVYVDHEGVMRWGSSKKEVHGFGVNYTAPFAHAYRSARKLNVDLEKAMQEDIYHFSRLGLDAFRVHVWDTEISDSVGNLLDNEHLKLFDFMLARMKERGIKIFITPIAFWGNGYPERDERTPGFATKYGKDACLTNPDAIRAQQNYLRQFVSHVNPYTKLAYKDDPDIVGFEISNEPHHRGEPEEVSAFINGMSEAIMKTGCKKPVFYNVSHSIHLEDAYFTSKIKGGTFQWYPTGLGARHELRGNFLPNVDKYEMPFAGEKFRSMAKIVYEFDAADVGRSYIYPAMARSFREAGIQWATHFAYDPTYMAFANTEYNTHFMNLAYAPQKAISLKISSEVFHRVPRYKDYGDYPANTKFDDFRVSYEQDLAELVTDTKFIYTNSTVTKPPKVENLQEISGYGSSPVVEYEGRGAYFLDRIEPGIWRLEVMPDALWIDNIFGRNSLEKKVAVINWREWPMKVTLPDLGEGFSIKPLTDGSEVPAVKGNTFMVSPGVYLISRPGVSSKYKGMEKWKNIQINEFAAPATNTERNYVVHHPERQLAAGKSVAIRATVVTKNIPEKVILHYGLEFPNNTSEMSRVSGYEYEVEIPGNVLKHGYLKYFITVHTEETAYTFPSGAEGTPSLWNFQNESLYTVPVVPVNSPLYLFNAASDADEMSREWRSGSRLLPSTSLGDAAVFVNIEKLFRRDPENLNAQPVHDYSLRYNFIPNIRGRISEMKSFNRIVIRAESIDKAFPIQVALIDRQGNTFGSLLSLDPAKKEYEIKLDDLKPVNMVILPRPYPTFLPYYFKSSASSFNTDLIETLQISIGPGLQSVEEAYRFSIESVRLEK
jgi:hypothetical protein